MKRNLFLSICLLWCCLGSMKAQSPLLEKYSEMDGVEYHFITDDVLNSVKGLNETISVATQGISDKIESIQIVMCDANENSKAFKKMKKDAAALEKSFKKAAEFEMVSNIKDDEDTILILWRNNKEKEKNEYFLLVSSEDDCLIVFMSGSFTPKDITKQ